MVGGVDGAEVAAGDRLGGQPVAPRQVLGDGPISRGQLEARYACQQIAWIGYKGHVTETCEPEAPHLVTHVATTAAPVADGMLTPTIHEALLDRALLPRQHLVDTAYLDAELMVTSLSDYGVDMIGPARPDVKWQARTGNGFEAAHFAIDWARQQATCPAGRTSISWTPAIDRRTSPVIKIKFSGIDCAACASRAQCLAQRRRTKYPRRTLTIRPEAQYRALRAARARQATEAFAALYGQRAGIEGTISQTVRLCGLRRSRYIGRAKTHLGHVLTAVAVNRQRIDDCLTNTARSITRRSAFARLMEPIG